MGGSDAARIRRMTEADIGEVIRIERVSYPRPWPAFLFRRLLRGGSECWVLKREGRVCGYGIMDLQRWAHVMNICVAPRFRGQGLGRRLLEHLLLIARSHQVAGAWLEVRPTSIAAIGLYRSMGFRRQGRRKHYYRERGRSMDAVLMTRQFR